MTTKTNQKHTPGPWRADMQAGVIWDSSDRQVTALLPAPSTVYRGQFDEERTEANALLIAAAPELVEALEAALAAYRPSERHYGTGRRDPEPIPAPAWVEQARAALAKARG